MDATVETSLRFMPRQPDGWLTRLFDNKAFLTALCMLPTAGLLIVFLTYPLGLGLWLSLTDTTMYTVVATVGKFLLGLWLAMLLNHHIPFKAFIRAIVLLPWIVPTVLSAIAWWWIYDPQFSIVSYVLVNVLHLR